MSAAQKRWTKPRWHIAWWRAVADFCCVGGCYVFFFFFGGGWGVRQSCGGVMWFFGMYIKVVRSLRSSTVIRKRFGIPHPHWANIRWESETWYLFGLYIFAWIIKKVINAFYQDECVDSDGRFTLRTHGIPEDWIKMMILLFRRSLPWWRSFKVALNLPHRRATTTVRRNSCRPNSTTIINSRCHSPCSSSSSNSFLVRLSVTPDSTVVRPLKATSNTSNHNTNTSRSNRFTTSSRNSKLDMLAVIRDTRPLDRSVRTSVSQVITINRWSVSSSNPVSSHREVAISLVSVDRLRRRHRVLELLSVVSVPVCFFVC